MGKIITEADLRSHPPAPGSRRFQVEEGTFVTESARAWLEKRDIELVVCPAGTACGGMPRTPLEDRGVWTYLDAATGRALGKEKPEEMTHLRGKPAGTKDPSADCFPREAGQPGSRHSGGPVPGPPPRGGEAAG